MLSSRFNPTIALLLFTLFSWTACALEMREMGSKRNGTLKLLTDIRALPVVKQKIPPVVKDNMTVHVTFRISIPAVSDVDDAQQTMTTAMYVEMQWTDEALAWNESDYFGVETVALGTHEIWTPELYVANSITSRNIMHLTESLMVTKNGVISASIILGNTVTTCVINVSRFPFDKTECPVYLINPSGVIQWSLSIVDHTVSVKDFLPQIFSNSWKVVKMEKELTIIPEYNVTMPGVKITMERMSLYYIVCLILPMVMTSYMNTLVFLLPLQSGEKISFIVSIFVSTSVFTGFFSDIMPRGLTSVPGTMKLLIGVISESLLVTLATIFVLQRHHKEMANQETRSPRSDTSTEDLDVADHTPQGNSSAITGSGKNKSKRLFTIRQLRVRVLPSDSSPERSETPSTLSRGTRITAEKLDHVFFWLAFVGDSLFLAVLILYERVLSDASHQ